MIETVPACTAPPESKNKKNLLARTVPPENCHKLNLLVSPVPQDRLRIAISTRKKNLREGRRKCVEPQRFNKQIWKAQREMKEMFLKGKLLGGKDRSETVLTIPPASKTASKDSEMPTQEKVIFGMKLKSIKSIEEGGGLQKSTH